MTLERKRIGEKLSRIVIHNETVYLCGQIPVDLSADFVGQTKAVLASIENDLAEAGTDNSKMLSVLIHVKDNSDVSVFNDLWNAWLPEGCAPARTCVQTTMANSDVLVELTVIAAL
ncbi:RidA family protein [Amphritea balenae]|mgnify:CR=1 FL=1|uniref:RidA family protein n=1 Tax=Amphritea balenae TaxID=452629 RepID=A0A3P1SHW5_9GAMM|nr:RidA family protein [Amphritea balenae]RRC96728.1 RidA family protein [Amphritea balenae]